MSGFNFKDIIAKEIEKQESRSTGRYRTQYPYKNGEWQIRLIGNIPSGLIYRELFYHEYQDGKYRRKLPCLYKMYNEQCPICEEVRSLLDATGDDNIRRKYGYKTQGIMFAKLISCTPEDYFSSDATDNNYLKPGDIFLFQFPWTVTSEISNILIKGDYDPNEIFANNTGRIVRLTMSPQENNPQFVGHSLFVTNNYDTICKDENGNPDDEAFNKFMTELPDLSETRFSAKLNESDYKKAMVLQENIRREYINGVTINPIPTQSYTGAPVNQMPPIQTNTPVTVTQPDVKITNNANNVDTNLSVPFSFSQIADDNKDEDKIIRIPAVSLSDPQPECYNHCNYGDACKQCAYNRKCL